MYYRLYSIDSSVIGSYRLLTHRRGAHRIFFMFPFNFKIEFCPNATIGPSGSKGLKYCPRKIVVLE